MSPSIAGPGSGASGRPPGSSSSIGKLITSVGPGKSIQRMCRSAIAAMSNSTIDSSAAGLTFIWSMTNLATLINSDSETSIPDSLATSMVMTLSPTAACARGPSPGPVHCQPGLLVSRIGADDFGDQPRADHVGTGELRDGDVVDAVQDIDCRTQARPAGPRQVDLRNIAGDNDFGAESQPSQKHLHLFGGGVLSFVEDDERVVQRSPAHVGQRRNLDHPGRHQLRDHLGIHHVVQGVVERPKVRVDLLTQRSWQK